MKRCAVRAALERKAIGVREQGCSDNGSVLVVLVRFVVKNSNWTEKLLQTEYDLFCIIALHPSMSTRACRFICECFQEHSSRSMVKLLEKLENSGKLYEALANG